MGVALATRPHHLHEAVSAVDRRSTRLTRAVGDVSPRLRTVGTGGYNTLLCIVGCPVDVGWLAELGGGGVGGAS